MVKVAPKLEYQNTIFKYHKAKGNVLIYIKQPCVYYSDDIDDGKILVVSFHPSRTEGNAFEVLHFIDISYYSRNIGTENISTLKNRMAKAIYE